MMDIREQLLAYLEGTLNRDQRQAVAQRLATSPHWQQELDRIQMVQRELKQEMPLLGQTNARQLQGLLPDILEKSRQRPRNRLDWPQLGMALCTVLLLLILVPVVIKTQTSVYAAARMPQNVPHVTSTPAEKVATDVAGDYVVPISQGELETPAFYRSASPVPAPGATAEASLVAFSAGR